MKHNSEKKKKKRERLCGFQAPRRLGTRTVEENSGSGRDIVQSECRAGDQDPSSLPCTQLMAHSLVPGVGSVMLQAQGNPAQCLFG